MIAETLLVLLACALDSYRSRLFFFRHRGPWIDRRHPT